MKAENEGLLSEGFADRVLARAEREDRRARRLRRVAGLAGAALLVAAVALPHQRHPPARAVAAALATEEVASDSEEGVDEDPGDEFFPDATEVASAEAGE